MTKEVELVHSKMEKIMGHLTLDFNIDMTILKECLLSAVATFLHTTYSDMDIEEKRIMMLEVLQEIRDFEIKAFTKGFDELETLIKNDFKGSKQVLIEKV